MAKESSSNLPALVVLLVLLIGAGTWNYQRNLKLENQEPRPFRSYSMEDLDALRAAYQDEVDRHTHRFRKASQTKVTVGGGGYTASQVEEFERVQRISQGKREIAGDYAKNQVRLDSVVAEITRRASERDRVMLFLNRLTKYP